jgi:hypothetical protein
MAAESPTAINAWADRMAEVAGIDFGDDFDGYLDPVATLSPNSHFMRTHCRHRPGGDTRNILRAVAGLANRPGTTQAQSTITL